MHSEVNPDIISEEQVVLFSKQSILVSGIFVSPILAGFFYCLNLYMTNQKGKIFGVGIAVITCNFFAMLPFLGFKFMIYTFEPIDYLHNIIVTSLMLMPMWAKHFEAIEYETKFPITVVIAMIIFIMLTTITSFVIMYLVFLYFLSVLLRLLYVMITESK